jgi:catechol 2,3-dioxygenase-like lactoylglutathione lyase family enzyme
MSTLLAIVTSSAAADEGAAIVQSKFELFVSDAEVSARFYTTLGFTIVQTNPDGYTTLQSGPAIIALSPVSTWLPLGWFRFLRHPPLGTEIVLYTRQLQALRERLIESGYSPGAITLQSWGLRDFRVNDHDGYYVRVTEGLALPAPD